MFKSHEKFYSVNGKRLILIVDDEPVNQEMLAFVLRNEYEVLTADNGIQAIEMMRENSKKLSLVLLDLLMPEMSGIEVLRIVREDPELCDIPIVVMTADQKSEIECLGLGAIDFISKPYPPAGVIMARVIRSIELSEDRSLISNTERDSLTGLYNREFFYSFAKEYDKHHVGVEMDAIVIDINHFHVINERYGKEQGDAILKCIGLSVRDIVGVTDGIVCRRSADTFLAYCPHGCDYDAILSHVYESMENEGFESSSRIRLRMGVYEYADKNIDIERRFDRAKLAADTIRNNFNKAVAIYDEVLHESELYQEQLTEDFHSAVENGLFKVYFQPKFDVRGDVPVIAGAEALVRWEHPEYGLISPAKFVPLFEENGMIRQLDILVWRQSAEMVARLKKKYGVTIPVSVNVSRIDLFDEHFFDNIIAIVNDAGIDAQDLPLEITESAYTDDSDHIVTTVTSLRSSGFHVEMDDFGTGYSSLGMVTSLPVDALKLDMTFVRNAFKETRNLRMIEIIMLIAEHLRVPVIAEGVETQAQMTALKSLGCAIVQGYYMSKPLPADIFESFVKDHI